MEKLIRLSISVLLEINTEIIIRCKYRASIGEVARVLMDSLQEPISLIQHSLDERVYVKMKGDRELKGKLHAFDQHLNMVLGDVVETQTLIESSKNGEVIKHVDRKFDMLFLRGDGVVLISRQ